MNVFQGLGLSVIAVVLLLVVRASLRGNLRRRMAAFWLLLWAGGGVALARPELVVVVARALGIGRGADLLLYTWVVATSWGFFWTYTRARRLERQITLLVRELAIASPLLPSSSPSPPSPPPAPPAGPAEPG